MYLKTSIVILEDDVSHRFTSASGGCESVAYIIIHGLVEGSLKVGTLFFYLIVIHINIIHPKCRVFTFSGQGHTQPIHNGFGALQT